MAKYPGLQTEDSDLGKIVRKAENDFTSGTTNLSKYVTFSLSENLNKIDAYINSTHISGDKDSQGRDKPFFNIVTAAVNIWFRATDIDRSDIKIKAVKSTDTLSSFLATAHIQEWMRRENFGSFLNDWGRALARYGSSVVEFVEKGNRLIPRVLPWNQLIIDSVDFENNIKIKLLELTEAQLRSNKSYDQDLVEKLCNARAVRRTTEGQTKDNKADYVKLYEVHGEMPLSYLTGLEADKDDYVYQMQVISYLASKEEGKYDDFVLVKGKERNPHMITHLIREDGRSQSIGAVEHLFMAQWMMNHTVKAIKDQLDLASKLIFQTSDGNFQGQNALTSIMNGQILLHKVNEPITQVANNSHDTTQLQNFGGMWKSLGNEIVGISEAMLGNTAPSGTAWRQVAQLLQENHSLFELMTENKGLHIEEMFRTYVIPFVKKQMNNSKEITATLDGYGIDKIDALYINKMATKYMISKDIEAILHDQTPKQDMGGAIAQVQSQMSPNGAQRYFKPSDIPNKMWSEIFKDLEWNVEVDITGESSADKDDLTTLTTVLQTIAQNPRVLSDPNAKLIFNKILTLSGAVSPLELTEAQPFVPLPAKRFTETMDYKDVPPDIQAQMEEQQGFQPSSTHQQDQSQNPPPAGPIQPPTPPAPVPPTPPIPPANGGGAGR